MCVEDWLKGIWKMVWPIPSRDAGTKGVVIQGRRVAAPRRTFSVARSTRKPGHSFILVDRTGTIAWRWDWTADIGAMYLDVDTLDDQVAQALDEPQT